jgi:SAM-dependent methyltransferase
LKSYDARYFRRWYGDARSRVTTPAERARRVALVLAMTEYVLERRARTVLDVGCGEGRWRAVLRRLRPAISYVGVDSSEYVIARYGRARDIRRGAFGDLATVAPARRFDIVVTSDVMHYLRDAELERGIDALANRVGGVAYLDFFTTRDNVEGDLRGMIFRPPSYYRRLFQNSGLVPLGMQFYTTHANLRNLTAMERLTG